MKYHLFRLYLSAASLAFTGCATQQRISIHCAQSKAALEQAQPLTYSLDLKTDEDPGLSRTETERYVRQSLVLCGFTESLAATAHFRVEVSCERDEDESAHKMDHRVEIIPVGENKLHHDRSSTRLKGVKERVVYKRGRQVIRVVVRDLQQKPPAVVWHVKAHSELPAGRRHNQLVPGLIWVAVQELGRPEGSRRVIIDANELEPLLQPVR